MWDVVPSLPSNGLTFDSRLSRPVPVVDPMTRVVSARMVLRVDSPIDLVLSVAPAAALGIRVEESLALMLEGRPVAVHYAEAYGDLLRRSGKAPVTFSRAGFTGSQAHGAFWAGDENSTWEAFRWSMFAGLNAAAGGIVYWGWDLAGFSGDIPTAELYLRSAAAATFVPIMQYHSEFNHHRTPSRDRTPWNIAERTGDDRVLPVFREFAQLRERLVPYLADETRRAVAAGEPLMRPLFFDAPDAAEAFAHPFQWMLGDELLVAPVVDEGADGVTAWLPNGEWVDAYRGTRETGGRVVERDVPIGEAAVWIRAGAAERLAAVFGR